MIVQNSLSEPVEHVGRPGRHAESLLVVSKEGGVQHRWELDLARLGPVGEKAAEERGQRHLIGRLPLVQGHVYLRECLFDARRHAAHFGHLSFAPRLLQRLQYLRVLRDWLRNTRTVFIAPGSFIVVGEASALLHFRRRTPARRTHRNHTAVLRRSTAREDGLRGSTAREDGLKATLVRISRSRRTCLR